jgi:hypothetical protein
MSEEWVEGEKVPLHFQRLDLTEEELRLLLAPSNLPPDHPDRLPPSAGWRPD